MQDLKIQNIPIDRINPAPYNPRVDLKPDDPEYRRLVNSMDAFGCVEPLVWNRRSGNLAGGHQRLKVFIARGAREVPVSVVDLSPEKEKALNVALNKIGGDWDPRKLGDLLDELVRSPEIDVVLTGFDLDEIETLTTGLTEWEDGDEPAEPDMGPPVTRPGELIELGPHRLLCGDVTKLSDVAGLLGECRAALCHTASSYGVSYDPRKRPQTHDHWIRTMIHRVILAPDRLTVELNTQEMEACREHEWSKTESEQAAESMPVSLYQPEVNKRRNRVTLTLPIQIKRLDGKRLLLSPDGQDLFVLGESEPKGHIVRAIGQAYYWRQLFEQEALTLTQLAERLGMSTSYVRKYLPLINLSPDILKRALTGQLPPRITLLNLLEAAKHLDWMKQSAYLGLKPLPLMANRTAKSS